MCYARITEFPIPLAKSIVNYTSIKEWGKEMRARVTEIFEIQYPIVQGGLAYLAYTELAAAVSNAGGLGQLLKG